MPNWGVFRAVLGIVPVITATFVVLIFLVHPTDYVFEPGYLLGFANTVFLALFPFIAAVYAARAYVKYGSFNVLMLGCGTLALGFASLIAGWMMGLPGSPNHTVTVHNIGAFLGGLCHFLSSSGIIRERYGKNGAKKSTLTTVATSYLSITIVLALIAAGTLANLTPPFFLNGPAEGPTLLRQCILLAAISFYALSAIRFIMIFRKSGENFFLWYALALCLIAIGLGAVFMQESVGSPIGWTGRVSQYLAGFYFLIVVHEAWKSSEGRGFSVEKALTFFFTASEQNYRALLECVNDAVFCFDRGLHVFLCNGKAEALLGRPRTEIVGSLFPDFFKSDEKLETVFRALEQQGASSGCLEAYLVRGDGGLVPVEFSLSIPDAGKNLSIVAVVRDISERRQMEEALRQTNEELELRVAERTRELVGLNQALKEEIDERRQMELELRERKERFRTLFRCMAQGAFYQNSDGRLIDVNDSALHLTGLTREQFLARGSTFPGWKVVNEDGSDLPEKDYPSLIALREGIPVHDKIAGFYEPQTRGYTWVVINALPYFKEGRSEPAEVFVTLHNITGLKRMEHELRKSRENLEKRVEERTLELQKTHGQLLHAEKLSAVGSLSASIAHEFNNPLQSVMTVIKGIRGHSSIDDKVNVLIDLAIKECGRMRDFIRNLQDFNRPTSGRWAPVNLNATIDCILLLGKYQYKRKGITVVRDYAAIFPQINAVADQVKQILLNLLNNATDACERGGTITVKTSVELGYVKFSVSDTGKGIPPEILPRIFEPFFTTKPESKGTGLGLSVSNDIAKRHGGRIEVESHSGQGSVFTVFLPINGHPVGSEGENEGWKSLHAR